ncbi:MAG: HemK/PrmC family methyltransferase [Devosia sp.]
MMHTFMNVEIDLGPGVLVPRQETELLGHTVLELLASIGNPVIIDMCCGSGNLALAIAGARPDARIFASDLTDETVATTQHNVERLGLGSRLTVVQGDMFSALTDQDLHGRVDLVVCNPPYISTAKLETDSAHLLDNEPRVAFDAGPYGISIHQRLIVEAAPFLHPGGRLAFEFGAGQDRQVKALLARSKLYAQPEFIADESGLLRVAVATII